MTATKTPSTGSTVNSYRLMVISAIFVTCLITANIMIVKQVSFWEITLPAAVIIFPISYIFGDVLTEVYGYRIARRVIWLGFFCNLVAVVAFWIGGLLPSAPVFDAQSAYERILGSTPRYLLASFLAYLVGEFANSFILAKMKIMTRGRWLFTRTIGSTIVGQGLDSLVVLSIASMGEPWNAVLFSVIMWHWLAKVTYEVVATPFTYRIVNYLKRKEGIDTYDYKVDFNPLLVTR